MGTKAIFKIYNEGKFVIGSWVKYNGGVEPTSIFPYFLNNMKHGVDKKHLYDIINQYVNDIKYANMFGDKKTPFIRQINDDGMTEAEVLFWDTSLSDVKLYRERIWADYTYEVRFKKNEITIKITYDGNEKVFTWKRHWGTGTIIHTIKEVIKWVDDIEYGLNDCDCKDEKIYEDNNHS